ncbi:hypothetical protein CI1B_27740 [Bradyrhizobium ivorense]|uniref:Uncharacterized protein n=1 Tax=Bradyrhizobium ivorense TaxID=2511166 RepID=A0A508T9E3_9BRAD|nr:hypothetical protein [Bradyrhizobium ivorense]VIO69568.1 hypothetical protein CI1B_27740 [Bradyrhizobium ivorense]VIO71314.1 hypothetical protein CI41S_29850 [Bradyrhizobium ivorense]
MELEPAAIERELEASAVLCRRAAMLKKEWALDAFDVDAAVLDGANRVGSLHQLAGGSFRLGKGAGATIIIT